MIKGENRPRANPETKPAKTMRELSIKELENVHGGAESNIKRTSSGIVGPQDNPELSWNGGVGDHS